MFVMLICLAFIICVTHALHCACVRKNFKTYPFHRIHLEIKNLCKEKNIKAVDLLPIFKNEEAKKFQISNEETHPNALANDIIAQEICSYLKINE